MSNVYTPDAQKNIDSAENKLGDAIKTLKSQIKPKDEPNVEIIQESTPDVDVVIDAPKEKEPRRSEFVKTDDPKVIERINDLYGQVKKSDARNQMVIEHNRLMEQKLSEYQDKLSKFEQETKNANTTKVEEEINSAIKTAWEEGDFDKAASLNTKLLDLKVERIRGEKPPEVIAQKPRMNEADVQFVHNAQYMENLATEKDTQGNLVRPYLYDWHPDNKKAVELFTSIPKEFEAAGKQVDMKTVMQVLDERIAGKKVKQQSSVLGSDEGDAPARTTVRLTHAEINMAKNMGITPERYARQKQLINS